MCSAGRQMAWTDENALTTSLYMWFLENCIVALYNVTTLCTNACTPLLLHCAKAYNDGMTVCVLLYSITARLCEVICEVTTECTPLLLHCIEWGDDWVYSFIVTLYRMRGWLSRCHCTLFVSHDGVTLPWLNRSRRISSHLQTVFSLIQKLQHTIHRWE